MRNQVWCVYAVRIMCVVALQSAPRRPQVSTQYHQACGGELRRYHRSRFRLLELQSDLVHGSASKAALIAVGLSCRHGRVRDLCWRYPSLPVSRCGHQKMPNWPKQWPQLWPKPHLKSITSDALVGAGSYSPSDDCRREKNHGFETRADNKEPHIGAPSPTPTHGSRLVKP